MVANILTQVWYHGNITRSKAEDLLSKAGKDGSYLVRDSESITGAYALCVLFQNCVYTYRILPAEDNRLTVQASEGVAVKYFTNLIDLIDFYTKEHQGLVTHLQYSVQHEEEVPDEPEDEPDPVDIPPQLPPRNIPSTPQPQPSESKDQSSDVIKAVEATKPSLSDTLLQRLQAYDTASIPEEHMKSMQDYLRSCITSDVEAVQRGSPNLPQLKKLLQVICKNLFSEVSRTVPTLEALQRVFDLQLSQGARTRSQASGDSSASLNLSKLSQITSILSSLEDKARSVFQEGPEGSNRNSLIPPVLFDVKLDYLGIPQKQGLKVDVEKGRVIVKKPKEVSEDKYYVHDKIRQLIKSQKDHNKLVIVVEAEKEKTQRKEYVFADSKKREGFCQLLQLMKNKHSGKPEPDMITLFIGTWNMGDAPPPKCIDSWFLSKGQGKTRDETAPYIPHDIYVIGTQEDPQGEKEWVEILRTTLEKNTNITFKMVAIQTLWNIRIVVLAKPEHENRISHICTDSVKTGIANTLGNKGAVGVSFLFNGTHFGFVNSHLTSGSEKKIRRNQNYMNILRFLNLGDKKLNPFDITLRFTHLFWLGDLNYRVDMQPLEADAIVQKIKQQQFPELLNRDQLNMERRDEKVFLLFDEEEIAFAPTYRFERNTRERYAYTKQKATGMKYNLPSWCDRVLWKSYPESHVHCQSYGCTIDIMTSDHSPVFATFDVGVTSQFVPKKDHGNSNLQGGIEFSECFAKLKTKSKTKFIIEFHSSCLINPDKSQEGENQEEEDGFLHVKFDQLPKLKPIVDDPEYLLDQHILISIKATDTDESYGEACVALRTNREAGANFQTVLTHHGEKTGEFRWKIKLETSEGEQSEKLYDFIKIEKDDSVQKQKNFLNTDAGKAWDFSQRKSKNSQTVAAEAAAFARGRGTAPTSEPQGREENIRSAEVSRGKTQVELQPPALHADDKQPEMFDNPLYGSVTGSAKVPPRKEQDSPRNSKKELPSVQDSTTPSTVAGHFPFPKTSETEAGKPSSKTLFSLPVPSARIRSYTCSTPNEGKNVSNKPVIGTSSNLMPPGMTKKPVVTSRSDGSFQGIQGPVIRPPLPAKSRVVLDSQQTKPRDYRETSEISKAKLREELPVPRTPIP
ncbi:phosphatidylinositol 3,4,5-trisphosphate 5-phosphatase 1 isoform X2 [Protopterus annectens]|uniref:phosphatidylinositol 3,4,5-trisphosphate 5-phosphatase 1 isoform X2 n=1 Tax=Protopterus annectens TaxID=7888 RepID=UPI001CFB7C6F|nr:phosphatidylinositol 3,4,5-trisphosphate 5-phosphatase 1 isoform X2 [Protopterus annectens]